ncbi:AAA family ATPase [Nocardia sp. NPDC057663]|uniref:AAA family ATPase n=1 Tax=Nocardia sp. NPDC057663 TaxID=3346201 RepID=UPI00366DA98B
MDWVKECQRLTAPSADHQISLRERSIRATQSISSPTSQRDGGIRLTDNPFGARSLFVIAARNYPDDPLGRFAAGIDKQIRVVQDWWCHDQLKDRAFTAHCRTDVTTRRDIEDQVHELGLRSLPAEDVAVLYVTGHGREAESGRHYLMLPTTPDDEYTHAYPSADIVTAILGSQAQHLLVIVNSCHSGALRVELETRRKELSQARRELCSLHVFTVGDFDQKPRILDFTRVLETVRTTLLQGGYAESHLSIGDFMRELAKAASSSDADAPFPVRAKLAFGEWTDDPHLCLPNPGYVPPDSTVDNARRQVADSRAEVDYWLDRASGRVTSDDPGWYFVGRRNLTVQVANFLRFGVGMLIVTGAAGTGKSAVIARAVTLSDPKFRRDPRYAQAVETAPTESLPPSGSVDIAVLARQKSAPAILEQILNATGITPTATDRANTQSLRNRLHDSLIDIGRTVTIVLDGLDEAVQPMLLLPEVVSPLAGWRDQHGTHLIRWVIGVRSDTSAGTSPFRDGHGLLPELTKVAAADNVTTLRTDGPETTNDIADYLEALLTSAPAYRADRMARMQLTNLVTDRIGLSFLDARLVGERLRRLDAPQPLDDTTWLQSLSDGTVGLLRRDIHDAAFGHHDADALLAVLRAAAFAGGAGVPVGDIWPVMAAAVLDRALPDGTIDHVLGGPLIGYLTRDVDERIVAYRPVHERLREVLRSQPDALREGQQ